MKLSLAIFLIILHTISATFVFPPGEKKITKDCVCPFSKREQDICGIRLNREIPTNKCRCQKKFKSQSYLLILLFINIVAFQHNKTSNFYLNCRMNTHYKCERGEAFPYEYCEHACISALKPPLKNGHGCYCKLQNCSAEYSE